MFGAFNTFGKLGAGARAVAAAWSPLALWPNGVATPGMWISPSTLPASFNDSTGTTPVATPGTVADSANPVGLALDIRAGATALADPGNHLSQSTSAARPVASARVNYYPFPTDGILSGIITPATGLVVVSTGEADPHGGTSARKIRNTVTTEMHRLFNSTTNNQAKTFTIEVKNVDAGWILIHFAGVTISNCNAYFNLTSGVVGNVSSSGALPTATIAAIPGNPGWFACTLTCHPSETSLNNIQVHICETGVETIDPNAPTFAGTEKSVILGGAQQSYTALPYQRVNTDSDYDATGITPFQLYDGTDDGLASATFAAGTLTSSMDCLIAVRRDSGANAVCGLYESVAEANKVFGIAESGSSSGCVGSGAGTPTVWVDNTQLTGGTAVTRGTLHTALTTGAWHILEFRGLDLSTWTASGFGLYTSYKLPGARGDIMLYPSTASTTDKDNARQYLADKYGVTLP